MKINRDFVRRGAGRMTENDVARVLENADAIGQKFLHGGRLKRVLAEGKLLLSLIRDYWTREYRAAPFWVIGAAAFALLYVLAPIDLMPDVLPIIGQIDDVAVVEVIEVEARYLAAIGALGSPVAPRPDV